MLLKFSWVWIKPITIILFRKLIKNLTYCDLNSRLLEIIKFLYIFILNFLLCKFLICWLNGLYFCFQLFYLQGLSEDDEVLQFGSVNSNNFSDITQIHNVVAHSVGQPIQVRVKRGSHVLGITVTPRPWAQPGLLGCQIRRLWDTVFSHSLLSLMCILIFVYK